MTTKAQALDHLTDVLAGSDIAGEQTVAGAIEKLASKIQDGTISIGYELPTASADTLGGVKVGDGLSIADGVLSASGGSDDIVIVLEKIGNAWADSPKTPLEIMNAIASGISVSIFMNLGNKVKECFIYSAGDDGDGGNIVECYTFGRDSNNKAKIDFYITIENNKSVSVTEYV